MDEQAKNERIQTIRLKRHLWPDELELRQEKAKVKRLKIFLAVFTVLAFACGWLTGTVFPAGGAGNIIPIAPVLDSSEKIDTILEIMETEWFFGGEIEDLNTRLTNQALYGITTNDEDPHTSYMSAEEIESFTQSINRNFVGIGVEFLSDNGLNMIQKVFKNSPAERAGVQPGDIIHTINGESAEGLNASEIKERVTGEKGTVVTIEFLRQGKSITLDITRDEVSATVYGKILEGNAAYIQLYQFGAGTAEQMRSFMEDFRDAGCTDLIIDLRDNGGGYLDAFEGVASMLVDKGTVVMRQEYADGTQSVIKTKGGKFENFSRIIVLVNENTASASEVLTLALKETRDDVTLVGKTTYGKGTVQISRMFDDGSALKYTTSKWISPSGLWINGTGIDPDEEVSLHDVMYREFAGIAEDEEYREDSVAEAVKDMQLSLDYLGYAPGRTDGYFSHETAEALMKYQEDHDLPADGVLNMTVYQAVASSVTLDWTTSSEHDLQLKRALEILHG